MSVFFAWHARFWKKKKSNVLHENTADLSSRFMKQGQISSVFNVESCALLRLANCVTVSDCVHYNMFLCLYRHPLRLYQLAHCSYFMSPQMSPVYVDLNSSVQPHFLLSDHETHTLGSSWLNISVPTELTIRSAGKRSVLSTTWLDTWFSLEHKKEKQFDFIISSLRKWIYSRLTLKTLATANTFDTWRLHSTLFTRTKLFHGNLQYRLERSYNFVVYSYSFYTFTTTVEAPLTATSL